MAFDGIITAAMAEVLQRNLLYGRIDKIYQPEPDELLLQIYTKNGIRRLFATVNSASASVRLIQKNTVNPPVPLAFCMLLRKHLSGARISEIEQKDSERILEISMETVNELGFTVSRKLIFEIMGKHSNIILIDRETDKILGSIKKVSIDMNRARQILPGKIYEYPPAQDNIPFRNASGDDLL
ncbi:MAG: NFACT family protein, partial [Eubacteriales bacterium]|nr:NFACT family protein [Eubacteriales bacterium]